MSSSLSANETSTTGAIIFHYGWEDQPDNRGTIDIIWSSIFTVFLCTWVMLCLNLPAAKEHYWKRFFRKVRWMILAIIGPEFVLTFAYGQWNAAAKSVKYFADIGYSDWTIRHGFFANMGGLMLHARDCRPFPINAKQLHWLVEREYLTYPTIDKDTIGDKSKADGFSKILTIIQTVWFILQCLGRVPQHLTLTTLELSAIAIVVCTLATASCWLHKPVDVEIPIILTMDARIDEILIQAGDAAKEPFKETPLDFIDNQGPSWSVDVMKKFHILTGPRARPLQRLANDRIPQRMGITNVFSLCILTLLYASIHLIGWNFHFATHVELLLWRICSLILFGTTAVFWLVDRLAAWKRHGTWKYWVALILQPKQAEATKAAQEAAGPPPPFRLGVVEMICCTFLALSYTAARLYLIVEVFLGLRQLPVDAFMNVQWTSFVPHI